jgi:hexosaminidase
MALGVVGAVLLAATSGGGPKPALMPWPSSIEVGAGELAIGPGFRIAVTGNGGPLVERAARRLEARLARQTGLVLPSPTAPEGAPTLEIRCEGPGKPLPHLGMEESYGLAVAPEGATLKAAEPWGVLRGMETFLQLVGPGGSTAFRVPAVVIEDRPRFAWRGLLLDPARHFMPVETVKRTLDGMAAVKLNVLHLHLTDDQGFRVESRRYPELHRLGSDGLFYTQEEVREIVAYAGERGIRVYPEIEMPGHITSWFVSHPELASMPGPYRIEREWGIKDPALDPSKEEVYRFVDGFLGEMAALFPDPYLHVGGDEVNGRHWDASERVAAFKKQKGFESNHDLLGYFSQRVSRVVSGHGKRMIGWDEILHPSLPKESVVRRRSRATRPSSATATTST